MGSLAEFRQKYGQVIEVKQMREHLEYQFFPTLEEANADLNSLLNKTGMMVGSSNLEDIFISLTGHCLG